MDTLCKFVSWQEDIGSLGPSHEEFVTKNNLTVTEIIELKTLTDIMFLSPYFDLHFVLQCIMWKLFFTAGSTMPPCPKWDFIRSHSQSGQSYAENHGMSVRACLSMHGLPSPGKSLTARLTLPCLNHPFTGTCPSLSAARVLPFWTLAISGIQKPCLLVRWLIL